MAKIEFSEEQKKAIENLKIKNEEKIRELDKVLKEYKKQISNLDPESKTFWDIMKSLEESNSNYPLGHFANYYYKDFNTPTTESFLTEFGEKNPNFKALTEENKREIESKFPDYGKYHKITSNSIENIKDMLKDSLSENIFIKRLVGLPEKYLELQDLNKNWWYPQELSVSQYKVQGSFPVYDVHLTINTPYHREKMIKYDVLFNTTSITENKIKEFISILKSINSYLPFAELIPAEKMPQTVINVKANANNESTSVGDSNKFKGDAIIGEGGKIGK